MIATLSEYIELLDTGYGDSFRRAIVEQVPEEIQIRAIRERPDLKEWVIRNKKVSEKILLLLSDDQDWRVRSTVAEKRKTPLFLLEKLAFDPSDAVRRTVAHHAKISKQILEWLAQDVESDIAERATRRLAEQDYRS